MKVGDIVKLRSSGKVGLVVGRSRQTRPDGNPNGDFMIYYQHIVLFDDETIMIQNPGTAEVINERG